VIASSQLVWQDHDMKRVLDPTMDLKNQVLLLLASATGKVPLTELMKWTDTTESKKTYFLRAVRALHAKRQLELAGDDTAQILPPGSEIVERLVAARAKK
jgi:hypothetical protein